MATRRYTLTEASRLTGVNYNTLAYWLRHGYYVSRPGPDPESGKVVGVFSRADLFELIVLAQVRIVIGEARRGMWCQVVEVLRKSAAATSTAAALVVYGPDSCRVFRPWPTSVAVASGESGAAIVVDLAWCRGRLP